MPAKHDAQWWRDHRAKKRAAELSSDQPVAQGPHFKAGADGKLVQSALLPDAEFVPDTQIEILSAPLPDATLVLPAAFPMRVELSSDQALERRVVSVDPHAACNLLESQLRARISELIALNASLMNQILGNRLIVDPSPLNMDDLGGVFE